MTNPAKALTPEQNKEQGKQSPGKKSASAQESRNRLKEATIAIVAGGDNTTAEVLINARKIADAELAPVKQQAERDIADVLVRDEKKQLQDFQDFFTEARSGGTTRLLSSVREDILEGEVLP